MLQRPWICRSCLRALTKNIRHRGLASTGLSCLHCWLLHQLLTSHVVSFNHDQLMPALLVRARAAAAEHSNLTQKIAESFDTASAKRLSEVSRIADAVKEWEEASGSLSELDALLRDPTTDTELRDLAQEDIASANDRLNAAGSSLTEALVPKHPFASMPCLIEIRPGVGGSEAALFAADLVHMYQAYCSRQGLRPKLLKYEDVDGASDPNGSEAPLREAILEVGSTGAYGHLRTEAGVHRVQRVPATESKGRTHTSTAQVLVLPSLPEEPGESMDDVNDPESDYYVSAADVKIETMRASGAGGQHVNMTDSAVRLTHIPTNTVIGVRDSRSQLQNRQKAWQILRARLAQQKREAREEEVAKLRTTTSGYGKSGRADKVRTYNWSQQRVTDHRSGFTSNQLDSVIDGGAGLDSIVESVQRWILEGEVQGLVEDMSKP